LDQHHTAEKNVDGVSFKGAEIIDYLGPLDDKGDFDPPSQSKMKSNLKS